MYRSFFYQSETFSKIENELLFIIASARACGCELIRFELTPGSDKGSFKRDKTVLMHLLKALKQQKKIQFFATERSFTENKLEAEYLYNKYESCIELTKSRSDAEFFYIKL